VKHNQKGVVIYINESGNRRMLREIIYYH